MNDEKIIFAINNNNNKPVVITGICDAMSLSVVRSIGKRNIPVVAIDSNIDSWFAKSKYLSCCVKCDSLFDDSLINTLINIAKKINKKPLLINCTDQSVINVSQNRNLLESYYDMNIPDQGILETLMNKKLFYSFAANNGFDIPVTYFTCNYDEIKDVAEKISYPCIVKPEYKNKHWLDNVPNKVIVPKTKTELYSLIQKYDLTNESLIFQEWIEGDDSDLYFCLAYVGKDLKSTVAVTGRKLRQHPHLAGTLSIAETINVPEVAKQTLRLFKLIGCTGFCSVEYKKSKTDGKFYIIEPTVGRPDSQEEMSVSAGVDIPYIAYTEMTGNNIGNVETFIEKIKWIDEPRMYYTIREVIKGDMRLLQLLDMLRGKRSYALFDVSDPYPSICFIADNIKKIASKVFK